MHYRLFQYPLPAPPEMSDPLYPDRLRLNRLGRRRLRRKLGDMERGWERGWIGDGELQARGEALFAHARFADDVAWRRTVCRLSRLGETQEPEPGAPGRLVEQHREELPFSLSQQEQAVRTQQEQRLSRVSGSQYDGVGGVRPQSRPADNASSRARAPRDETMGKSPASADIQLELEWPELERAATGVRTGDEGEDS